MRTVRPGSHLHRLITIMGIVGEYPLHSVGMIGNERVMKELIHSLLSTQEFRHPDSDVRITAKLIQVSGKGSTRFIRLHKSALPILEWIHPEAYRYYMASFYGHRFPGDSAHRDRNFRVAESIAMTMAADVEMRAYLLPKLQNQSIRRVVQDKPVFYLSRDIKKISPAEQNKTMFTRTVGAIFCPTGCYAVYNTRNAAMKWAGMGEFKALQNLIEVARMNTGIQKVDSAVLIGESCSVALKTLMESEKSRRLELRFDGIYHHVYFIPMDSWGIRRLRIMMLPHWKERLLDLLFDPDSRSYGKGFMEYDAQIDGVTIYSHLDGDIARLIRFREAQRTQCGSFEVLCYPDQVPFLREYLGPRVVLKTIDMDLVENELR